MASQASRLLNAYRVWILLPAAVSASISAVSSARADAPPVWTGGVVAADHPLASQAGLAMLEKGGNAVDAAVAASFALSVVRPYSCGIGGGGFMLIHLPDNPRTPGVVDPVDVALDYRETAPAAVGPEYFERLDDPDASTSTGHAVGVPGAVAGLLHALERFGALDRATVLAPAIRIAEEGWTVDAHHAEVARDVANWLSKHPERRDASAGLWSALVQDGKLEAGAKVRNPAQARALRLIAEQGEKAFYDGPIAQEIIRAVRSAGGAMTREDLRGYRVRETEPLAGAFHGMRILAFPPPSSGGVATLQILGLLERIESATGSPLAGMDREGAPYLHALAESFKHAFADRARFLGDAGFAKVPVKWLLSAAHLDEMAARFNPEATLPAKDYGGAEPPPDDSGTSHVSIVDQWGGAVACTETINLSFGSKIAVEPFGFALNNEMDDFTTRRGEANAFGLRQSDANLPAPGKRPLSSMSPTIVLSRDSDGSERVALVAGASGGPRIITGTVQVLLNALVFNLDAKQAVSAPRIHHQWLPGFLQMEPAFDPESDAPSGEVSVGELQAFMARVQRLTALRSELKRLGHSLATSSDGSVVQIVKREGDGCAGASDPRKGGAPAGRNR